MTRIFREACAPGQLAQPDLHKAVQHLTEGAGHDLPPEVTFGVTYHDRHDCWRNDSVELRGHILVEGVRFAGVGLSVNSHGAPRTTV